MWFALQTHDASASIIEEDPVTIPSKVSAHLMLSTLSNCVKAIALLLPCMYK